MSNLEQHVHLPLDRIVVGQPLPGPIYVQVENRYVTLRGKGDVFDRILFDKLQFKGFKSVFVLNQDLPAFMSWAEQQMSSAAGPPAAQSENHADFLDAWKDAHRKTLDIFSQTHPDKHVAGVIAASRKLVGEAMKRPYVVTSMGQLQSFSRGTVDHSVNVSVLATYLALQMGYTNGAILQTISTGALLHDIGKRKVDLLEEDGESAALAKMKEHSKLGLRVVEAMGTEISEDIRQIVAQHHEFHDGSGYPRKLRGNNIFDLARIVTIANEFDELVSGGHGTLHERQRRGVILFDEKLIHKIEPDKHEKAVAILKLGL